MIFELLQIGIQHYVLISQHIILQYQLRIIQWNQHLPHWTKKCMVNYQCGNQYVQTWWYCIYYDIYCTSSSISWYNHNDISNINHDNYASGERIHYNHSSILVTSIMIMMKIIVNNHSEWQFIILFLFAILSRLVFVTVVCSGMQNSIHASITIILASTSVTHVFNKMTQMKYIANLIDMFNQCPTNNS